MILKKRTKNILAILILIAAVYLSGYILVGKPFVPQNFKDARVNAAKIAGELVALLNESSRNLEQINDLDKSGESASASEMVSQELQRSSNIYSKSIELSNEFQAMADALNAVAPVKARDLADDAIKDELGLIGKIIEYNSLMSGLLENLKLKFSAPIKGRDDVQKTIDSMNAAAKEVNDLNSSYNQKMEEFDNLTK